MTNGEKFKTAVERAHKFKLFCESQQHGCNDCELTDCAGDECRYAWLDLEYKEKLKPCPFCGGKSLCVLKSSVADVWHIACGGCGIRMEGDPDKDTTIAAWNRRAK